MLALTNKEIAGVLDEYDISYTWQDNVIQAIAHGTKPEQYVPISNWSVNQLAQWLES